MLSSDSKSVTIKSGDLLRAESEKARMELNVINEAVGDLLSLAEGSLENWQGDTAEEFARRSKAIGSPLNEVVSNLIRCMNELDEIVEKYDNSRKVSGSGGEGLPDSIIY